MLRGGLHYLIPIQFVVHIAPLVTIAQGKIGYIFARDGSPLSAMQVLASNVSANDFQNVGDFLGQGGQRGPQRQILREGTYAINLAQFVVITEERAYFLPLSRDDQSVINSMTEVLNQRQGFTPVVIKDSDDLIGVVASYNGTIGEALSGSEYRHGELVSEGNRGVWSVPLLPGKYAFNTFAGKVISVPTTNIIVCK